MYVYEDQYGWVLAPATNSTVPYVRFFMDFQKTYRTRDEATKRMLEILAELGLYPLPLPAHVVPLG
tara:strand:+ start:189 stop:386 length:198 start_codon:yes stop_codon:yes gene_type:complete